MEGQPMCKFKDTTLGIKKLDFGVKRGAMAVTFPDFSRHFFTL